MNTLPMAEQPRVKGCCQELPAPLHDDHARELASIGKAFADPTRIQMLHMLKSASDSVCVCDFTAAFSLGQPTISHHIAKLKAANLVDSEKIGIWSFYRLRKELSPAALKYIELIP